MFVGLAIISKAGIDIFAQLCTLVQVSLEHFLRDGIAGLKGMYTLRLFDTSCQNSFLPGCSNLSFHQQRLLSIPTIAQV